MGQLRGGALVAARAGQRLGHQGALDELELVALDL